MGGEVVYLDRDGTINIDRHYLSDPEDFSFCPGALTGLIAMRDMGLDLVVVTNQSGIARGYFDTDTLDAIHTRMTKLLADVGVTLAGIYSCPHGPEDACDCRKPKPGLIARAEAELGRRPGIMIGDKPSDVIAGQAAGLTTVGLFSHEIAAQMAHSPDYLSTDLRDAAAWIAARMDKYK